MIGRRITAEQASKIAKIEPGDYWQNPDGTWDAACPVTYPDRRVVLASLCKHTCTENPDGTLTVAPSILVWSPWGDNPHREWYHGFLERGVWREA